jgi:hypothetical protein
MLRLNAVGIQRLQAWEDVKVTTCRPGVTNSDVAIRAAALCSRPVGFAHTGGSLVGMTVRVIRYRPSSRFDSHGAGVIRRPETASVHIRQMGEIQEVLMQAYVVSR